MRIKEVLLTVKLAESAQQLTEINMSPGALSDFVNSPAAKGMRAGFEAELIFRDANTSASVANIPNYDDDVVPESIDDVIAFFTDDSATNPLPSSDARQLEEWLHTDFNEWVEEQVFEKWDREYVELYIEENSEFDYDDAFDRATEALDPDATEDEIDEAVAEQFDKFVDDVFEQRTRRGTILYHEIRETFLKDFAGDYTEADWFNSKNMLMSDIADAFGHPWPYYEFSKEGGFNVDDATRLANSLEDALGVSTVVSADYHDTERNEVDWIFEPDSSITADGNSDLTVEIVSPPMPLKDCVEILPMFFAWAEENDAYANASTGFHMSVSIAGHETVELDYTKLALLLGDQHVLKQFDRTTNTYTVSGLGKVKRMINTAVARDVIPAMFDMMRTGYAEAADRALARPSGFGKHVSISPREKYIEFRSAGNIDYFANIDKIISTLLRYARATAAAMDPRMDRNEYLKKFYRMLMDNPAVRETTGQVDTVALFVQYSAGVINRNSLKQQLLAAQGQNALLQVNNTSQPIEYMFSFNNGPVHAFSANSIADAYAYVKTWAAEHEIPVRIMANTRLDLARSRLPAVGQVDMNGNYSIVSSANGQEVYRFSSTDVKQAQLVFIAWVIDRVPLTQDPSEYKLVTKE